MKRGSASAWETVCVVAVTSCAAACGGTTTSGASRVHDHVDAGRRAGVSRSDASSDASTDRSLKAPADAAFELDASASCVIATGGGSVYFAAGGLRPSALMKMTSAGNASTVLARFPDEVMSLAVDANYVFVAHGAQSGTSLNRYDAFIDKVALNGGNGSNGSDGGGAKPLTTATERISALSPYGPELFFMTSWIPTFDPADQNPNGGVFVAPVSGGPSISLLMGLERATSLSVDSEQVYWAEHAGAGCSWGCVMALPRSGGLPYTLAFNGDTTQEEIPAMAQDGSAFYFTNAGIAGTVETESLSGGKRTTLATAMEPQLIAIDADSVYFTTSTSVMKVSKAGGVATTLATTTRSCGPCALAVDGGNVYWVSCGVLTGLSLGR